MSVLGASAAFTLLTAAERDALAPGVIEAYPVFPTQAAACRDAAAATEVAAVRLPGRADPGAGADRLRDLVARHELLRATLSLPESGRWLQILAAAGPDPEVHDLREAAADDARGRLSALIRAERSARIDPAREPLLRLHVVLEPGGDVVLLAAAHRALADLVDLPTLLCSPAGPPATGTTGHAVCVAAELEAAWDLGGPANWRALADGSPFTLPAAWAPRRGEPAVHHRLPVPIDDLMDGLRGLADAAGVAIDTVLLAAHLRVLGMLTPEPTAHTEARLAATHAGEGCAEPLHSLALPLAVSRGAATWRELVAGVGAEARAAWRYRHSRPEPVRAEAERLAGALFVAHPAEADAPVGETLANGLRVDAWPGRVVLSVHGAAATGPDAERLAAMYRLVLAAMAAGTGAADAHPPDGEVRLVLDTWAAGPVAPHEPVTVVDLLRERAAATPDALAVRGAGIAMTFAELDARSDRLARHLIELGARPEALVGVSLERTADLLPALLGVWKSGAGYLPLDPALPAERLRHMTLAAGCRLVVAGPAQAEALGDLPVRMVLVDRDPAALSAQPDGAPDVRPDPANLAYVIYTSGSTGTPKGVLVQHDGLVNYLRFTLDAYVAAGPGGAPVFSSISFDLGIPNLFAPLLAGQPVHLLPDRLDVAGLGEQLAAGAPYSFIKLTPGHLDLLTHQLDAGQARSLAGIVIAAGDAFTADLARRWLDLAGPGGTRVATEYGPTEITIGNSGEVITAAPATELVPLGDPIPNTTMYVLDEFLRPAPIGVPGEVYIGGAGVSRGYLGRPDLTADRFVPDPYGPPGARLYRSGDLARRLPGGALEFLGRVDNQVKIRGYRVELGEIQACLCRHPGVRDAVVAPRRSAAGDERLVGYVVPAAGWPLDAATLREHLAALLPEYMIPARFVAIDRVPLTPNGKIDVRALPALP
ncbi:amino acid adenylation domain-containing protein [Dactylosporangium sp. CA-233914]|uniref:non-ribosomal peptide synthetase family protein n=1 Tax=Dactylosporangium sp. CA-233914 TaxID=3239934 RepID=UPI003D909EFA